MILKKSGAINEIVYKHTVYNDGEYRLYPTLIGLRNLIKEISKVKKTTKYIRFTPFYKNAKVNEQIEFGDYMFYIECREFVDTTMQKEHIGLCIDKQYDSLSDEEIKNGETLYPLCQTNDYNTFNDKINNYSEFLEELLPQLLEIAKLEMKLQDSELAFGYFCFEVHSE